MALTTPGLVLALLMQGGAAQPTSPAHQALSAKDSERVLGEAREAQLTFEFVRRRDLEIEDPEASRCAFATGRFCHWHDDDEDALPPPPEAPTTLRARLLLLDLLSHYADSLPGDNWILGQRVRYYVDEGRPDTAIVLARHCLARAWWCSALAGYAYHLRERYASADSAYQVALNEMPPKDRCRWTDISFTLDGDLAKEYAGLDCAARERFARRLDSIAAPLYMISRTDLWTEHLARETYTAFAEDAATTEGLTWHNDMREMTIRFGWPVWYTQSFPVALESGPEVAGHERSTLFYYFPPRRVVDNPSTAKPDDWRDDDPRAPSGYAPEYARAVHELPHQIARFRRGDTALVMAAWNGRQDGSLRGSPLQAAVVIAPDPSHEMVTERAPSPNNIAGQILARGAWGGVLSIELLSRRDRRAARARIGLAPLPSADLAISDLLLFRPTGPGSPQIIDSAAATALTDATLRGNRRLGVYWELYPAKLEAQPVKVSINVDRLDVGWLKRTTDKLHLTGDRSSFRVEYADRIEAQPFTAKSVQLDLSHLSPGSYRIRVTVTPPTGTATVATREVTVE